MCDLAPRDGFNITAAIFDANMKMAGLFAPRPQVRPVLSGSWFNYEACFTMVKPVVELEGKGRER